MLKITNKTFEESNWANLLTEEQRGRIAAELKTDIEQDDGSRSDWLKASQDWVDLAMQVRDNKSFPWSGASNIKFPLLTTASMQFHSRAQQALLKGRKPLKAKRLGPDPDGQKEARGKRIEDFMGYNLLDRMEDWEDELDRLLMILPIVGLAYKKIYRSISTDKNKSELVLPHELILNYSATDFNRARRTHVMTKFHNEVVEMQRGGFFLDVKLTKPTSEGDDPPRAIEERCLHESHCWLDLDDDGYEEPYIVTLDTENNVMLRLAPRYGPEDVIYGDNSGDIVKITPHEYFVRYIFLPAVDSKLYGVGLGTLVGPTNMAVNTLINQLVDSGSLAVLPSGFLGRGGRLQKSGSQRFAPGEWKTISATGDDLRKSIFPLPVKEPSNVLFQLLGLLVDSGKQIGSVADIMMGENPGQNQPYSTTQAVLEQGMQVFVGIYKRVYRAMSLEYIQLMGLCSMYEQEVYQNYFDQPQDINKDFNPEDLALVPVSDPDMVSTQARLAKAEALLQMAVSGLPINVQEALKRVLEAQDHENIEALMQVPEKQPSFEERLEAADMQAKYELEYAKLQAKMPESQSKVFKDIMQGRVNEAKAKSVEEGTKLTSAKDAADAYLKRRDQDITEKGQVADLAKAAMAASTRNNNATKASR